MRKLFTSLEFRTLHERLKALKLHATAASPCSSSSRSQNFVRDRSALR